MTLKEQFDKISCKNCDMPWCDVGCTILSSSELNRLEKIADDFAIGFAEWLNKSDKLYIDDISVFMKRYERYTKEQALFLYKKEKGL